MPDTTSRATPKPHSRLTPWTHVLIVLQVMDVFAGAFVMFHSEPWAQRLGWFHFANYAAVAIGAGFAGHSLQAAGGRARIGPVWGAVSFFVPLVQFFVPYRFVEDLWQYSVTEGEPVSMKPVQFWWAAWIVDLFVFSRAGVFSLVVSTIARALTCGIAWKIATRLDAANPEGTRGHLREGAR